MLSQRDWMVHWETRLSANFTKLCFLFTSKCFRPTLWLSFESNTEAWETQPRKVHAYEKRKKNLQSVITGWGSATSEKKMRLNHGKSLNFPRGATSLVALAPLPPPTPHSGWVIDSTRISFGFLFKFISADWILALQFSNKEKNLINNKNALINSSGGSVLPPLVRSITSKWRSRCRQ